MSINNGHGSPRSRDRPADEIRCGRRKEPAQLDEVGYLSFDTRNADLLFQVVSRRYERKSLVLTTNLSFQDWPSIFPNATCATALIDRVIHHADVIAIESESYRLREAEKRAAKAVDGKETALTPVAPIFRASR
jgi:hypothetical protein